jgi:hypothetical protein
MHFYLLIATWVAYSAGAVAGGMAVPARRRVNPHPSLFETALMAAAVLAAAMARATLSPWHSAVSWCLAWATIAFALRFVLARRPIFGVGGSGDFVPLPETSVPPHATVLGRAWQRWKSFGHAMADFQGRVLLTLCYFTLVLPLAIGVTWFKDPLGLRRTCTPTWHQRPAAPATLEAAKRQI